MKKIKLIFGFVFLLATTLSCSVEGIDDDTSFVTNVAAPSNVVAYYNITQDNTGTVTITPNGEGAVSYDIYYGDATTAPVTVLQGKNTTHVYNEGTYTVKIVATGITGVKTEVTQSLIVSFKAPENLVVGISNDNAISKKVNVTANADFATMFDVYFGEPGNDDPVSANIGETASYVYQQTGTYTIKVVAKSAAIQTTIKEQDFIVTAILAPTTAAPTPTSKQAADVISIFSDSYTNINVSEWNPGWGQSTTLTTVSIGSNNMLQYSLLNYTGIVTDYANPTNLSSMEYVHFDYWTPDATKLGFKIVNTASGYADGAPSKESIVLLSSITKGSWVSVDILLSDFTTDKSAITQLIFESSGSTVFIDNLYFYKNPTPASGLEGTWKIAPEAGSIGVGPAAGDKSWFSIDAAGVTTRACFYDDTYVFGTNGSFSNVLGSDTWLENWQGTTDACGTPVSPHNGGSTATYIYDSVGKTITINGAGAYLGIPKATNAGELPNVAVPNSIVYSVELSNGNNTMELIIETGSGVFWHFKLVRV